MFSHSRSLSVCGCCAWVRVGAFAHQQSYVGWITNWLCGILFVYWLPCILSLSFFCIAIYSNLLFLSPVLLVSLLCNLFLFFYTVPVLVQANRSTYDIIMEKKYAVKGIPIFLPLSVLTFSFHWLASFGVIIIFIIAACVELLLI